jgi:hypothetical protein
LSSFSTEALLCPFPSTALHLKLGIDTLSNNLLTGKTGLAGQNIPEGNPTFLKLFS